MFRDLKELVKVFFILGILFENVSKMLAMWIVNSFQNEKLIDGLKELLEIQLLW